MSHIHPSKYFIALVAALVVYLSPVRADDTIKVGVLQPDVLREAFQLEWIP